MDSIPLDRFLDDLADRGLEPQTADAQEDVALFWSNLDEATRQDVLEGLGLDPELALEAVPILEDGEIVFADPDELPEDPALAAAEAMQDLADLADAGFEDEELGETTWEDQGLDAIEPEDLDEVEVDPFDDDLADTDESDLEEADLVDAEMAPMEAVDPEDVDAEDVDAEDLDAEDLEGDDGDTADPDAEALDPEPLDAEAFDDLAHLDENDLEEADLVDAEMAPMEDLGEDDLDDLDLEDGELLDGLDLDQPIDEPLLGPDSDLADEGAGETALEDMDAAALVEAEEIEDEEHDEALADTGLEDLAGGLGEEADEKELEEIEVYPVYEPYAYVRIAYDPDNHQYLYEVIEPDLNEREEKILQFIEETIVDVIDVGLSELTEREATEMVTDLTNQVMQDYSIDVDENARTRLTYYTVRDFTGFGKLDVIMRDPMIEDISCDGEGIPIFLYHRKYESVASTVVFEKAPELDSFVIKLAQRSGKHISIADPLLDARLPDGSRLNATLGREVTAQGSTFTIRKFRDEPFTPPDMVRFGTQSPEMLAYYWMAVQHGASIIYAGGTASGKTTALNAIMLFIPPQMKIVSIEDTRELNLPHPNWIPGTTRSGFGSRDDSGRRAGEIDMFELLKAALRQRPEYIAVGEVRGEEATVLFQAMATGHAAYGTMHADSVTSVIHRLEGEPINIPRPLLEALDIVTIQMQTRIGGKRVRRTKEIVEIVGLDPNTKELLTNEVFHWDPATDEFDSSGISYVLERIQKENNLSSPELRDEMENRTVIIRWMLEAGLRDYEAVAKVVQAYYNEPEETMRRIREDLSEEDQQAQSTFGDDIGAMPDVHPEPGEEMPGRREQPEQPDKDAYGFDIEPEPSPGGAAEAGGLGEDEVYEPPEPARGGDQPPTGDLPRPHRPEDDIEDDLEALEDAELEEAPLEPADVEDADLEDAELEDWDQDDAWDRDDEPSGLDDEPTPWEAEPAETAGLQSQEPEPAEGPGPAPAEDEADGIIDRIGQARDEDDAWDQDDERSGLEGEPELGEPEVDDDADPDPVENDPDDAFGRIGEASDEDDEEEANA